MRGFKPYSLSDYQKKDKPIILSKGLGSNLGTEEWIKKQTLKNKIKDFTEKYPKINVKKRIASPKKILEENYKNGILVYELEIPM